MSIDESLSIHYEDAAHKRYADLLMRYGFTFEIVAPGMRVGLAFTHPAKLHRVYLERETPDEDWTPKLMIYRLGSGTREFPNRDNFDVPMQPTHYSDFEWRALQDDKPDDFTFLERELHIWFKVRPKSLNTQLRLD